MDNDLIINENNIEKMIYELNGTQVMLDSDLGILYNIETKRINEAVRRNQEKFPKRISWVTTEKEIMILRSQNATANISSKSRVNPRVFTEQGIYMLATILKTPIAIQISIKIMDTFVKLRHYLSTNILNVEYINERLVKQDNKIDEIIYNINENKEKINKLQKVFDKLNKKEMINSIFYKGQIYDAYSKIIDIFKLAKKELIIIDNYADKKVLDMICNINVKVILIVKTKTLLTKQDIQNYNKQYNNLKIVYNDTFHDRYFIIDENVVYHCGASINYAGSKTFSINILNDQYITKELIRNVNLII